MSIDNPEKEFKSIREKALDVWINGSGRELFQFTDAKLARLRFDRYESGYECNWQNQAGELVGTNDWHVSYFCSLGDWASNITDLLLDERCDKLSLSGIDQEKEIVFRYYTRFFLVLSEMITDFEEILKKFNSDIKSQEAARRSLSKYTDGVNIEKLMAWINCVCKHKARGNNFHHYNHHLPIWFDDSGIPCTYKAPISYSNCSHTNLTDSISMPKLEAMVQVIIDCYKALDTEFTSQVAKFEHFCKEYGKLIPD